MAEQPDSTTRDYADKFGSTTRSGPRSSSQAQPPKSLATTSSDRIKTLIRMTSSTSNSSLTTRGGARGAINAGRSRGSMQGVSTGKSSVPVGLRDTSKQQQRQQQQNDQKEPSYFDADDSEAKFQYELDEEFGFDEPSVSHQRQLQQQSTSGSSFQLFGGAGGGGQCQSSSFGATLQEVSASEILKQYQNQQHPDQLDVSLLMHNGLYGTSDEIEKLLAQAIQFHCRSNRQTESSTRAPDDWINPQQCARYQVRPSQPAPTASSTMGLAEDLMQAWSSNGGRGGGTGGKSVHFTVESSSNGSTEERQLSPNAAAAPQQRQARSPGCPAARDPLMLTDYSEEDISEALTDGLFLTAKPPVPKPRIERSSTELHRQGGEAARSATQSASQSRKPTAHQPQPQPQSLQPKTPPNPTARFRWSANSMLGQPTPPKPAPRGRPSVSLDVDSEATQQRQTLDAWEDNATVQTEFVDKALDQLLEARQQATQSWSNDTSANSAAAAAALRQMGLANELTTARRPMDPPAGSRQQLFKK